MELRDEYTMLDDIEELAKMKNEDLKSELKIAEGLAEDTKTKKKNFKKKSTLFIAFNAGLTIQHFLGTYQPT
jgi:hypothetical protein